MSVEEMGQVSAKTWVRTTPAARDATLYYFRHNAKAKEREQRCSGFNVMDPQQLDAFFSFELHEPEHRDVYNMVMANDGVMTLRMAKKWIRENAGEIKRGIMTC